MPIPMLPIMMLSNGILSILNQRDLAEKNKELQLLLEENRKNFQRESFERASDLQREITLLNHKLRLTEQKQAFENTMQQIEFQYFMQNWPLITPPFVMREEMVLQNLNLGETRVGLRIILTKSTNTIYNKYVHDIVEHGLLKFINRYFGKADNCPVFFYSGGWKSPTGGGGAANSMLHYALKRLPTLVIDPNIVNDTLNFDIAVWGLGAESFLQDTLFEIPFERRIEKNVVDEQYYLAYADALQKYINYTVAWIADIYNILEYNQSPILPNIISNEQNEDEHGAFLKECFAQKYKDLYDYILGDQSITIGGREVSLSEIKVCILPDLCLGFSRSTFGLMQGYPSFYNDCIRNSLTKWLMLRGIATENQNDTYLLNEVFNALDNKDIGYLNALKESYILLRNTGDHRAANAVLALNRKIVWLK